MEDNNFTPEQNPTPAPEQNAPASPEQPAAPEQKGAGQQAGGESMRDLVKELAEALRASAPAQPAPEHVPPEPTEAEKQAAAQAAKKAQKLKARKKRRRAFGSLLLRIVLLAVVVYVLFFHIIGVTVMPNGDMYPRIDSGDLVLFYRLDKDVRAQDIIVFRKDANSIQDRVNDVEGVTPAPTTAPTSAPTEAPATAAPASTDGATAQPGATGQPAPADGTAAPVVTAQPTDEPVYTEPTRLPDMPPEQVAADDSFMARVSRWVYDAEKFLGLRNPEGKQMFVCRVVACAGDTVEITEDGRLVVNGNTMIESNIFSKMTVYEGFTEYPLTLRSGECFVLADQRNGGADSRFFGPVNVDEILGTVITIARRNNL